MVQTPTAEKIIALAPDLTSAKAARDLAIPSKWRSLGRDDQTAWGECQGSGSSPYQSCIDLDNPAYKCSCPSRKLPCKHALALAILLGAQPTAFAGSEPPGWVADWVEARRRKAQKKVKEPGAAVDVVAQAKRVAERTSKVAAGAVELDRWLQDLVRRGLANAQKENYAFWENQVKRLVDAQAPGLARLLKECADTPSSGEGWPDRLLRQIGHIHLLIQAQSRIDELPPAMQADIQAALGFTVAQDDVLAGETVTDTWMIVAQRVEIDDKLRSQRTWLRGSNTGKLALVLSFAYGTAVLDTSLLAGYQVEAELAFYPGNGSFRALVKNREQESYLLKELKGYNSFSDALSAYAAALAINPWIERFPMAIEQVTPVLAPGKKWCLKDVTGAVVPLTVYDMTGWQLIALSGGEAMSIFGEWDGERLLPLSAFCQDNFYRL